MRAHGEDPCGWSCRRCLVLPRLPRCFLPCWGGCIDGSRDGLACLCVWGLSWCSSLFLDVYFDVYIWKPRPAKQQNRREESPWSWDSLLQNYCILLYTALCSPVDHRIMPSFTQLITRSLFWCLSFVKILSKIWQNFFFSKNILSEKHSTLYVKAKWEKAADITLTEGEWLNRREKGKTKLRNVFRNFM